MQSLRLFIFNSHALSASLYISLSYHSISLTPLLHFVTATLIVSGLITSVTWV